ncbi:MAG: SurA N-terminal domain-containing protein [Candidatus Omnitrophica bacterium]|nr:SurA N-terminal domain-containing protein [Candidatus Omnitrophota bacterium]
MRKLFLSLILFALLGLPALYAEEVSKIIAKVNNQVITSKDLNDFCKMLAYRLSEANEEAELSPEDENFQQEALEKLIEDRLIFSQAKKENIEVPTAWVEAKLNEMIAAHQSRLDFEQSLTERGLNVTMLRTRIKEQYMVRQLIDRYVRAHISVSPQELRSFYEEHPDKFSPPLTYVIWIATSKDKDDLIELGKLITEKGFIAVEKEHTEKFVKLELTKDQLREEVAQLIQDTKEGHFIIKKFDGNDNLIYFEKTLPMRRLSFEEAGEQIYSFLWKEKFKKRYQEWVSSLKAKATIKNHYQ